MGNCCAKNGELELFEKNLIHFKGQKYDDIKARLKGDKALFEDDHFRHTGSSLGNNLANNHPQIEWIRATELPHLKIAKQTPYVYYPKGKTEKNCQQGRLGNCWFCATAAALSSNVKLYAKNIQKLKPQTFEESDYFGIFHFRFYHLGDWIDVVIDDYLPTIDGSLIFAHSKDPNEFWPALLEKAYAKFLGNYDKLEGGDPLSAGINFTGGFTERYNTEDFQSEEKIQELYRTLSEANQESSIITCSTSNNNPDGQKMGLKANHAYSITKLSQFRIRNGISHTTETLVRIRNPWGEGEWKGAWSDYSDEMKALKPRKKWQFGIKIDNDGEFHMRMSDFVQYFCTVQIVAQKPKGFYNIEVHKNQVKGSWKRGSTAGGRTNFSDNLLSRKFATNPQYLIKNEGTENCKCVVALSQSTMGIKHDDLLSIGFNIYQVVADSGKRLGQEFCVQNDGEKGLGTKNVINIGEIMITLEMKPGFNYVIIPFTYKPDQEGNFLLRFVSENLLTLNEL